MKNLSGRDLRRLGLTVSTRRFHYKTLAFFYYVLSAILFLFFSVKLGLYLIYNGFN